MNTIDELIEAGQLEVLQQEGESFSELRCTAVHHLNVEETAEVECGIKVVAVMSCRCVSEGEYALICAPLLAEFERALGMHDICCSLCRRPVSECWMVTRL